MANKYKDMIMKVDSISILIYGTMLLGIFIISLSG